MISLESNGDRLVVVGGSGLRGPMVDGFAARHPDWDVVRSPSFLSGIAEICRSPARAVVAMVEPSQSELSHAVAGLRHAGGPDTRLILCCAPESEPAARAALECGADDYVVWPVDLTELEAAIGIVSPTPVTEANANAGIDEIAGITKAIASLEGRPGELLQELAEVVRTAVGATGVTLSMQGAGATSGAPVTRAVLAIPIPDPGEENAPSPLTGGIKGAEDLRKYDQPPLLNVPPSPRPSPSKREQESRLHSVGQLVFGEKEQGPYTPDDIEKLTQYARLIGGLLASAAKQRHWRELALTDIGSGLPNRRYLQEQLPKILQRASHEHFAVTVLLFDVDDFKSFNDRHGHDAGDEILRVVGQLFRKTCREQDVVTRYGGDEFAVVFWDAAGPREPGSKHPQQALSVVDRFTEALRTQRFSRLGQESGSVTISGGLATFPWDAASMDDLISKADQALLIAKRAGKNRVVVVGG